MRNLVPAVLASLTLSGSAAAQRIPVPAGNPAPVLVDGRIEADEWADAASVALADSVRLLVKQSGGHVFLAIRMDGPTPRPVDLYLIPPTGRLHQLHASMALGERLLPGTPWSDDDPPWRWHYRSGWTANTAELDRDRPDTLSWSERLVPADGVEFQIRRSRFPGEAWTVRIEIGNFPGAPGSFVFPVESSRDDPGTWAMLELGGS